jgi:hypothetical protein
VLVPATGVSALALAAVMRLPPVMLPATAVELASPLAPSPVAVADAVPPLTPPLPPVAVAFEATEVVPMPSLVAEALPPAAPMPPAPPKAAAFAETL